MAVGWPRLCAALMAFVLLTGAAGKPAGKKARSGDGISASQFPLDDLPPIDAIAPEGEQPPPAAPVAPPVAPVPPVVATPSERLLHLTAGGGLDVPGAGFDLAGGGFAALSRRFVSGGALGLSAGVRATWAMRVRQVLVPGDGHALQPAAVFYAQAGDVSPFVSTSLVPVPGGPLELAFEAGAGLAWRSGRQSLVSQKFDASGLGLASHVATTLAWHLGGGLAAGVRVELSSQPQPVRLDVPAMPTDLGALRLHLFLDYAP